MKALIDFAVPPLTVILLFGVGLDLRPVDFARVQRQRALVMAGLLGPLFLLPPLAVLLIWLFEPVPDVSAALLLVAACPIGGISNAYSQLARASTALSVALTGLSCLMASVTIPALSQLFELAWGEHWHLTAPVPLLLGQLLVMLALPVALGMWVRARRPGFAQRWSGVVHRTAFAGIAGLLALLVLEDRHAFFSSLASTVPLAVAFIVCSMATGWLVAVPLSRDPRDKFTFAAEFGTRNLGVATAIAVTLLDRIEFARFAYTYFLTEIPIMLLAIAVFRRSEAGRTAPPVVSDWV